ncbi:hypothetical protein AAZX31_02G055400 [Glycine max]
MVVGCGYKEWFELWILLTQREGVVQHLNCFTCS